MRGGQVSIEYLMVTGFSFMLLIPLLILFNSQSTAVEADLLQAQAQTAAEAILQSAERVYYVGPPAKETITVYIPANVQSITLNNDTLVFRMLSPTTYDYVLPSPVPLIPMTVPPGEGRAHLEIEAALGGVRVSEP